MPVVPGEITPTSPLDTYPIITTQYQQGGVMTWFAVTGDWLSTTNLPNDRREAGMIVGAQDAPRTFWVLAADLTTWTRVQLPYALPPAVVATNTALTADALLTSAGTVMTLGRAAAGDGGHGIWRWVPGGVATVNAGTVLSGTGGQWQRVIDEPGVYHAEWWTTPNTGVTVQTALQNALDIASAAQASLEIGPGTWNFTKLTLADDMVVRCSKRTVLAPLEYTTEQISTTGLPNDNNLGFIIMGNRSEFDGRGCLIDMKSDDPALNPFKQSVSIARTTNVASITLNTVNHGYVAGVDYVRAENCSDSSFDTNGSLVTAVVGAVISYASTGANVATVGNTTLLLQRGQGPTLFPDSWTCFKMLNLTAPKVHDIRVDHCYTSATYVRNCVRPEIYNVFMDGGYGACQCFTNTELRYENVTCINSILNFGWVSFSGVWFCFEQNQHSIINKLRTKNQYSVDAAYNSVSNPGGTGTGYSYVGSVLNLWGEWMSTITDIHLEAVDPTSKRQFSGILVDGCMSCVIDNFIIEGENLGTDIPLAIEGAFECTISNGFIDGKRWPGTTAATMGSSASGIYVISRSIRTTDQAGYQWLYPGTQTRGRSFASRNKFIGITVRGHTAGVWLSGSNNDFIGCDFSGNLRGVRLQPNPVYGENYEYRPIPGYICYNNTFTRCRMTHCGASGVTLAGCDDTHFYDCDISCNDQSEVGASEIATIGQKTAAALLGGSSTTVLNWGGSAITTDELLGYQVYLPTLGTGLDYRASILSNTASTITLMTALPGLPGTALCAIDAGPIGDVYFNNCRVGYPDAGMVLTEAFGYDPTQTCNATTDRILITTRRSDIMAYGQRVVLKGALSAPTPNSDLTVYVYEPDVNVPDGFWCMPVSAAGTEVFALAPGGSPNAVVAGTGTVSYTDAPTSGVFTSRCTIGFSGVVGDEIDARYYIGVDVAGSGTYEWRRIAQVYNSGVLATVDRPFSANFAVKTYRIIKCTGNYTTTNTRPFNIANTEGRFHMKGTTYTQMTAANIATNCINFPLPLLTVNDTTPDIGGGSQYAINNTSATLISNFTSGQPGKVVQVYVYDANTTLDFTGSSLRGYGSDQALAANTLLNLTYANSLWYVEILA